AVLFLATGTAHTHDAELPDQMFGAWCEMNNPALDRALPNNKFYSKCENGYLFIFDKGLKYKAGGSCEFASSKFDRREDAYDVFVVRANCKGIVDAKGNPYLYSEIFETATSEGQLSRRILPKDSARSGKGRKSVMFMRLVPDSAWWTDCRHGSISKAFAEIDEDNPPVEVSGTTVTITYDELRKLLKVYQESHARLRLATHIGNVLMIVTQAKSNTVWRMIAVGENSLQGVGDAPCHSCNRYRCAAPGNGGSAR